LFPPNVGKNPDSKNPDSRNPDSRNPDSKNPDSKNPDSRNPYSKNPDSRNPDSKNPDSKNPDSKNPDSRNPDSINPDSKNPDIWQVGKNPDQTYFLIKIVWKIWKNQNDLFNYFCDWMVKMITSILKSIIRKIKIHAHENTKETHTGQRVSAQHVSHSKTENCHLMAHCFHNNNKSVII
jgi:hypothetical protein